MKQFAQTYYLLQFIICLICLSISCGEGGNDNYSEANDERNKEPEITVSPVTNLEAKSTQIANQLLITWQNPNTPNLLGVELSYLQKNGGTHNGKQIIQGAAGKTGGGYQGAEALSGYAIHSGDPGEDSAVKPGGY